MIAYHINTRKTVKTRKTGNAGKTVTGIFLLCLLLGMLLRVPVLADGGRDGGASALSLTAEEQQYIRENPVLTVSMDTSWIPYCFETGSQGTIDGILPRFYELIAEKTGLQISFLPERSYMAAIEQFTSGEAMLVSGLADDQEIAAKNHAGLSDPYIQIYYSAVTKNPSDDLLKENMSYRVAVCRGSYSTMAMKRKMPSYEFVEYSSNEECMDAVLKGDVDITLIATHAADYYSGKHQYAGLHTVILDGFNWGLCVGINENCDPLLKGILNKAIAAVPSAEMNQAVTSGILAASSGNRSLVEFLYAQPVTAVCLAAFIVAMILVIVFQIILRIRNKIENQRLEQALKAAELANQSKTEFLSRVSHDMRTPMNGILGMAELSEDETDAAVLKNNIRKIKTSGEYLLGLINDTLDFQRIESGKLKLEPEIVNCRDILKNILEMVEPSMTKKKLQFTVKNKNVILDGYIRVDPVRMKQIFLNLLSNAVKFTPEGGSILVEYECLKRENGISRDKFVIRDTGIGMSREFMDSKIFQPFSQEYNEVTGKYAGSGLGLSIVKRLVELMGGSISVESELGVGTAFTILLDFENVEQTEAVSTLAGKEKQKNRVCRNLSGRKLLLVEDHPLNAEIATKLLKKAGCEVTWAENGKECLDLLEQSEGSAEKQFDAVLMDIRMPVMDGLTATVEIRKREGDYWKNIPVIAMTANAYEEDVQKCRKAGMNAHLAKPIDPTKLYETIGSFLNP